MESRICLFVLLLPFACRERVDAPASAPPTAAAESVQPLPSVAPEPAKTSPADAASASAPAYDDDDDAGGFDAYAWAAARGIDMAKERVSVDGCSPVTLGDPAREALWCDGGAPIFQTQGGESVFPLIVVGIDHGHLRELLRAPLYAGALDFDSIYVRLVATLSPEGRTITISERPEQTCSMARAAAKKLFPAKDDATGLRDWLIAIDRACAGAARYTWTNDRFVRAH